jgi:hypothetical protein
MSPRKSAKKTEDQTASTTSLRALPFDIKDDAHHWFELRLPAGVDGEAVLVEIFAPGSGGAVGTMRRGLEIAKGRMPLSLWSQIDDRIRAEFNGRLKRYGAPPGTFATGINRLAVHIGWEIALLFWGGEDAPEGHARRVFNAWSSLAAEERWWLYNQTANFGGAESDRNTAWRTALRLIFQDAAMAPEYEAAVRAPRAAKGAGVSLPRPPGISGDGAK